MYCIVLYWWDGQCCPMHCDLFKIYCAHPNWGITRTWIWRLNFAQRAIFSGLRFFNEAEISDSEPPAQSLSRRTCTSWKNPSTAAGFERANLGSRGEQVSPRPRRPTIYLKENNIQYDEGVLGKHVRELVRINGLMTRKIVENTHWSYFNAFQTPILPQKQR